MAEFSENKPMVIGTYNMSWFSGDSTKPVPVAPYSGNMGPISEYSWLRYLFDADANIVDEVSINDVNVRCKYWLNALNHLNNFINEKTPAMVGLQEMNVNTDANVKSYSENETKQQVDSVVGTKAVETMLNMINENKQTNYKLLCGEIYTTFKTYVGICIIYDETQVGEITEQKILDNPKQSGRPLLMAKTNKNYILVNMHGAQDGKLGKNEGNAFNEFIIETSKNWAETKISEFIGSDATPKNIFIVGDLNDRYDAITSFNINGIECKYSGMAPVTGCPNWNSAGVEELQNTVDGNNTYKTCTFVPEGGDINIALDEHHAKINNYLYRGDKCFCQNGSNIIVYPTRNLTDKGVSKCSDHEVAYMEIPLSRGGKPTKKRKNRTKKRILNKRKSSRRMNKSKNKR